MTILRRGFLGILMVLSLGSLRHVLAADGEPDTSGSATVGVQGLAGDPSDAAKFFEYRDVPDGFVAERFQFHWTSEPLSYLDLDAIDTTQRDSRGSVVFGRRDLWKGTVTWRGNSRRWGDDTRMLFANQGSGVFTLDDALQSAIQAAPASVDVAPADGQWDFGTKGFLVKSAVDQGAQRINLGFQRRTYGFGFDLTPTRSLSVGATWSRETREGANPQPLGMYFALSPAEVAAPVDFRTDWGMLRAELSRRKWNVGVQLAASRFNTNYDTLRWDNQLSLVDQAVNASLQSVPGHGQLTLWTDNKMVQGTVYGGVNLPGHTRINATASLSITEQDDPFLPMTVNGSLAPLVNPLPADEFDGKHRNDLLQVRGSGRPLPWFRWNAWGRKYELNNESPSLRFAEYVQTDYAIPLCSNANACGATINRIQRRSLPYAYEKVNLGAMAGFMPLDWLDVSVSYDRENVTREFSAVEDSSADTYKLTADFDVSEWLTVRATGQTQRRRTDKYEVEYLEASFPIGEPYIAGLNEGIRRFIWTDRDRDAASLYFEVTPAKNWALYGETTYAKDDYLDPATGKKVGDSYTIREDRNFDTVLETYRILLAGRTFDKNSTYTLGVTFSPNSRFDVYADYTWERFNYALASRYRSPSAGIGSDDPRDDWGSDAQDTYRTTTVGLNVGFDQEKTWTLAATGSRSEGIGNITTDFVGGGAASGNTTLTEFPQLDSTLTIATVNLTHRIRPSLDYALRYLYENWEENNWAGDLMRPYMGDPLNDPGSVTSIYLGMDFDNYTYHVVSLMVNYHW